MNQPRNSSVCPPRTQARVIPPCRHQSRCDVFAWRACDFGNFRRSEPWLTPASNGPRETDRASFRENRARCSVRLGHPRIFPPTTPRRKSRSVFRRNGGADGCTLFIVIDRSLAVPRPPRGASGRLMASPPIPRCGDRHHAESRAHPLRSSATKIAEKDCGALRSRSPRAERFITAVSGFDARQDLRALTPVNASARRPAPPSALSANLGCAAGNARPSHSRAPSGCHAVPLPAIGPGGLLQRAAEHAASISRSARTGAQHAHRPPRNNPMNGGLQLRNFTCAAIDDQVDPAIGSPCTCGPLGRENVA